jgi:hypothetical protein
MENLFTCVRFDGHKELTQMGKLFAELERTHNNLTSLSYDGDEDGMCFEAAVFCAKRDYAKALDNLKQHCHNMEKSNQMAGVM